MSDLNFNIPFEPFAFHSHSNGIILTGQRFTRLLVVSIWGKTPRGVVQWLCRCDCGEWRSVAMSDLRNERTRSCGSCVKTRRPYRLQNKPRLVTSPEYNAYRSAKMRCNTPTARQYPSYGGRGIEFRFQSFEEFFAHIGGRPTSKHSLDRIDNNGHYEKGNVRWATQVEQCRNQRTTRMGTLNGVTKPLKEWAENFHIDAQRVAHRVTRLGWDLHKALTAPIRQGKYRK